MSVLILAMVLALAPAPGDVPEAGLPPGAIARLGEKRFRFELPYDDFLLTPDGKLLAALNRDKVCLGELATGKEVAAWPNSPNQLRFAGLTANGKELATWSHDKAEIVFHDLTGQRKAETVTFPLETFRHVMYVALSPDGRRLAFVVEVEAKNRAWCRVDVMDRDGRKALFQKEHTKISSAVFTADGKTVAVASEQYDPGLKERVTAITLYNLAKGQMLQELGRARESQRRTFEKIAFSSDDKNLASFDRQARTISFWDVASGKEILPDEKRDLQKLAEGFPLPVRFAAWSIAVAKGGDDFKIQHKDDHYRPVAITSDQRTLLLDSINRAPFSFKLLDIATRKELPLTAVPVGHDEVHFLAEGDILLARQFAGEWQLWDVRTRKVIPAFDNKSAEEAARKLSRPQTTWFDDRRFHSGFPPAELEKSGFKKINFDRWEKVEEAGRSPDEKIIVQKKTTWSNFSGAVPKRSVEYSLLETATGKQPAHLERLSKLPGAFCFSPDSRCLVMVGQESDRLLFVEIATGKEVAVAPGRVGPFFSPSSKQAAVVDGEKGITLVDLIIGKKVLVRQEGVSAVAFSPRGDRLAGASRDGTLLIWDLPALSKKE